MKLSLLAFLSASLAIATPLASSPGTDLNPFALAARQNDPMSAKALAQAGTVFMIIGNSLANTSIPNANSVGAALSSLGQNIAVLNQTQPTARSEIPSDHALDARQLIPGSSINFSEAGAFLTSMGQGLAASGIPLADTIGTLLVNLGQGLSSAGAALGA